MDESIKAYCKVLQEISSYLNEANIRSTIEQYIENIKDSNAQLASLKRASVENPLILRKPELRGLLEEKIIRIISEDYERLRDCLKTLKTLVDKISESFNIAERMHSRVSVDLDPAEMFYLSSTSPLELNYIMYHAHEGRKAVFSHYSALKHHIDLCGPGTADGFEDLVQTVGSLRNNPVTQRINAMLHCIAAYNEEF